METFKLNNGMEIPAIGFGCYNAKGGDSYEFISIAITSGYTLFDTASIYGTEKDLGNALRDNNIDRSSVIIQSKLWIDEMGYEGAKAALERTLTRLGTDYLDVYMIHWPKQHSDASQDEWKTLQRETYKALEEMVDEGSVKAIGLSNFLPHHLDNILSFCNTYPVIDQLEYHIGYTQEAAKKYAADNGLCVQAWSPLGRESVFKDENLKKMASKYNVTVAQLVLRFNYQSGVLSLPKASSAERQIRNLNIWDFSIDSDDFNFLSCLPPVAWSGEHPDTAIPTAVSTFKV